MNSQEPILFKENQLDKGEMEVTRCPECHKPILVKAIHGTNTDEIYIIIETIIQKCEVKQ
jgi:hypothetical protein